MGRFPIAFLFLTFFICDASRDFGFTCQEAERKALLMFRHSLIDTTNRLGSWVGEDCCSWEGVGCDNITGNVVMLDLRADPGCLFTTLPCLKVGEVNSALLELKYLRHLDLSGNYFGGSTIPEFLGSMRQLQYLNLSYAFFGGKVPHHLGNLSKLSVLDLRFACPFCEMEGNNLEWAFRLGNLQYLDLSYTDLSQALDALKVLNKLPSLLELRLSLCQIGNSHLSQVIIDSNISSSNLQHLALAENSFDGPFPHFIQNLSSIRFLDLSYNGFNSSIPSWLGNKRALEHLSLSGNYFNSVDGGILSIIARLCSLKSLDLSSNMLEGEISLPYVNFSSSLQLLHLYSNFFKGPFPQFIQNSSSLTDLDLSDNQFNSSIPSWLTTRRDLEHLFLSNNHFNSVDGGIPGHLCSLKSLDLSSNMLTGEIWESHANFSRCSKYDLEDLYLENNNISGHLPNWLGKLKQLRYLFLSNNSISGTIPASTGGLSSLILLDLSYNHLHGVVQQVCFSNMSSLENLYLSFNSLTLELSPDWAPPFQLEWLLIPSCKINAPFPQWLLTQKVLIKLDLSNAGIIGSLPDNIGNKMPSLMDLWLANNHINGSIPRSLCKLANLRILDLRKNRLSGTIPDCWMNSQPLGVMELSSNRLSGPIPNSLTKIAELQLLSVNNNSLEGKLPLSFNCIKLGILDVGKNNLHGEIPPWINGANFPALEILILRENRLKGIIPPQLCSIRGLQIIDLASNSLTGTIPKCFGHFNNMGFLPQSNVPIALAPAPTSLDVPSGSPLASTQAMSPTVNPDEWIAVEVIKGKEREYTTVLHLLVNMDLSCNNLIGVIPTELTSLTLLVGLNLSHNNFTERIPKEIGKMKSLESLDLSSNLLSGAIPESISDLTFLAKMNLSFNNLQGQIPTGRQLQVLGGASMYMGNPGLCGDPLPKKCSGDGFADAPTGIVPEDEEEGNKKEKMWFYLIIMLGFATGFWGVIGILIVNKRWRHAYFRLAEELADWIYVRVAVRIAWVRG